MGDVHPGAAEADSLRLLHGVGIGSVGSDGSDVVYTQLNPVELEFWTFEGNLSRKIKPSVALPSLSQFLAVDSAGEERLSPLIPHATGLEAWGNRIALSAYSPAHDSSSLWVFDGAAGEVGRVGVPFDIRIRAWVGEIIVMERQLSGKELAGYSLALY